MRALRILFEDEHLLVADKPSGFYSMPSEDKSLPHSFRWDALNILEKQTGQRLYPAHRLDRATSGLLLFSKRQVGNGFLQRQFQERRVEKRYYCLVRGRLESATRIDTPLKKEDGGLEEAITMVNPLAEFTLPIPGPHEMPDRRFTFVRADPVTGRFHQIRRHLASLSLPIVGDARHGDRKVNRAFAELTLTSGLFLRCMSLGFEHPTRGRILLHARWAKEWHRVFDRAGVCVMAGVPSALREGSR